MKIKIFAALIFLFLMNLVTAQTEVINIDNLKNIAIPIHIAELFFALFIAYMSLKFFNITKPISLFLYVYTAIGFFIINTLLFLFLFLSKGTRLEMNFTNVYLGSRIALLGMLVSFVIFFYLWNHIMRKVEKK